MSEKDGKRVLSPEEKAEADAPTNKQWLDTIGGPTGNSRAPLRGPTGSRR